MSDSYKRPFQVRADYRRRDQIALSDTDKLRIDYGRNSITLKRQEPFNDYPTDNDLYVELPIAKPIASAWSLFESVADVLDQTDVDFQVQREEAGTWLYWDGGSWSVASLTNWNTEAEISENLSSLNASSYLRFRARLRSLDGSATPEVYGVNFSYLSRIDPYEDFLYRVVLPFFKDIDLWMSLENIMNGTNDYIDLVLDGLGYQLQDVIAAYNLTVDPNRTTDIASGYNPAQNRVTLSTTPSVNDIVEVRMSYKADALSSVGVDYAELDRVPAYIIEGATVERVYHNLDDAVKHKDDKRSEVFDFEQSDWSITIIAAAGRQVDLARMLDHVKREIASYPFFYSYNFDERYGVIWTGEPDISLSREISDLREARFTLEVHKVPLPLMESDKPLVTNFEPILQRRAS